MKRCKGCCGQVSDLLKQIAARFPLRSFFSADWTDVGEALRPNCLAAYAAEESHQRLINAMMPRMMPSAPMP